MAGREFPEQRVGQFMYDQFSRAFFTEIQSRTKEIEQKTREVYNGFFRDISGMIGGDSIPPRVAQMGVEWAKLSDSWVDRKGASRSGFYRGLGVRSQDGLSGGSFRGEILSKTVASRYGLLKLRVKTGTKERDPKDIKPDLERGGFRYKGQFTSLDQVGAKVSIEAFPLVKRDQDLQRGFSPRIQNILQRNEPWGGSSLRNGVKRPFLTPMVRYYTQILLPGVVERTVGTR